MFILVQYGDDKPKFVDMADNLACMHNSIRSFRKRYGDQYKYKIYKKTWDSFAEFLLLEEAGGLKELR
jgi:hypothetical protein